MNFNDLIRLISLLNHCPGYVGVVLTAQFLLYKYVWTSNTILQRISQEQVPDKLPESLIIARLK